MTTYRILPDGRRRALPDGTPRSVGQPGPAGTAVSAAGSSTFAGVAAISAAALLAASGAVSFSGSASISSESVGPSASGQISFSGIASASANASADALGRFSFDGAAHGLVTVPLAAAGRVAWTGAASIAQDALIAALPGVVRFTGSASASLAASLRAVTGTVSFDGSANPSVNTAAKWLSIWERVYAARQVVLNAVDANNRFLAKQAGADAKATADALVITNTRVDAVDDRVTAESQRTTLLTTEVQNVQTAATQGIDSLRAVVDQQGDDITSLGESVTGVQAQVGDPAAGTGLAGALQTLSATTSIIDGKVTAQGQAITAVEGVAGNAASTAATALTAANNAAEAVTNVQFEVGTPFTSDAGWEFVNNHRGFSAVGAVLGSWPVNANDGATVIESTGNDPQFITPVFSLAGGPHPIVRAYVRRRSGAAWDGRLYWSNNNHGFSASFVAQSAAPPIGEWTYIEWDLRDNADFRSSPLNRLRFDFGASSDSIVDVKWIALGNYGQGRMAQATETMRVGVDSVTGRLNSTYALAVRVDNKVIGARFANDGVVGRLDFVGDAVAFLPPDGSAQGLEMLPGQSGLIRQFGAGWQRIQSATPFGPDGLVMYFGPNVGVEAASKAFATKWEDSNGNAYTGGSFSAGLLRNAAQSSQLSTAATVDTGPFSTNGRQRVVASSLSYSNAGISATDLGPDVALTATVVVERSRDDGASWAEITRFGASGQRALVSFEPGVGYIYQFTLNGSSTYSDNTGGTENVSYRLRIIAASGPWPFNFGTGSTPLGRQSLAIVSTEQPA